MQAYQLVTYCALYTPGTLKMLCADENKNQWELFNYNCRLVNIVKKHIAEFPGNQFFSTPTPSLINIQYGYVMLSSDLSNKNCLELGKK